MKITIVNNKGGTGKTTTSVNLAAALAASGRRVLLMDLDSQASASFSLGVARENLSPSAADLLFDGADPLEIIRESGIPWLDLITGEMDLASSDMILAEVPGRELRLARALRGMDERYDFILFDCPPSLSLLSINALMASEYYLIPVFPEYLALEGLLSLMEGIQRLKQGMGLKAQLLGILLTSMSYPVTRKKINREIAGLIREHYGEAVFETEIPRDVRLEEAPAYGKSVLQHAPRSRGARGYAKCAEELLRRCGVEKSS